MFATLVVLVTFHNTCFYLFILVECVRIERLPNVPNILCNHYTTHSLLFFATGGGIEPPMVIYLQGQNLVTLPNSSTPQFTEERWGVDPHTFQYQPFSRRCHKPLWLSLLMKSICQWTFFVEVSIRFELTTPGYKAVILPTILKDQFFGYKKTRTWF